MKKEIDSSPLDLTPAEIGITCRRILNAGAKSVREAICNPRHLANWWAPKSCSIIFHEIQFYTKGRFHFSIEGYDQQVVQYKSRFEEFDLNANLITVRLDTYTFLRIKLQEHTLDRTIITLFLASTEPHNATKQFFRPLQIEERLDKLENELQKMIFIYAAYPNN